MNTPPTTKRWTLALTIALAAVAIVFAVFTLWNATKTGGPDIDRATLERLASLSFQDVKNQPANIKSFQGKVVVLNFWATWCPPCRQEMPAFSKVSENLRAKGVVVLGIGIDSPSAIKEFALQFPVSYPLLIGGSEGMQMMRELGNPNAALPFTFVIRRDGLAAFSHLGMLTEETLTQRLLPLVDNAS